jgi:type II secretory pathway component PulF
MKTNRELNDEAAVFRALYLLLQNEVPFGMALEIVAMDPAFSNHRIPLMGILKDFRGGMPLGESFKKHKRHFTDFIPLLFEFGIQDPNCPIDQVWEVASILTRNHRLLKAGVSMTKVGEINFYRMLAAGCKFSDRGIFPIIETAASQYLSPAQTKQLVATLTGGESLSIALAAYKKHFTPLDIVLVEVGELSGSLTESCKYLADVKEEVALLTPSSPGNYPANLSESGPFKEMLEFQNLARLLDSGLPLLRCLKIMIAGFTDQRKKDAFTAVHESMLNKGMTLSEAMLEQSEHFSGHIILLTQRGERMGVLELTFKYIVEYLRWNILGTEPTRMPALAVA